MRRTLVALLFTLGLSACGGVEEAEPATVDQFMTPCLSACWGSCTVRNLECREGCEAQCAEEPAAPVTKAVSNDVSSLGYSTCGGFRQRCCLPDYLCNVGLVCDPTESKCYYEP